MSGTRSRAGSIRILGRKRSDATVDLQEALERALAAADPETSLRRAMDLRGESLKVGDSTLDLSRFRRVMVIGGGKASGGMASALEGILGDRVSGGVVNIPDYLTHVPDCRRIVLHRATHPIPSAKGVAGVRKMLGLVGKPSEDDLVICLISGGGSALLPLPAPDVNLDDLRRTTDLLLRSGARISEINAVRKHLSAIKGGRLAERLHPATVLSLIISDVVGDELDAIASGPTVPDSTTYADAEDILKRYSLWTKVPARARASIERGVSGRTKETPKEGSEVFRHVRNVLVGSNRLSCLEAGEVLRKKGYRTLVLSTRVTGEARDVGRLFADFARGIVREGLPFARPACIVGGGETTVTVRGRGVGGRNQELALSAAIALDGLHGAYVASIGTDGVDGPTGAAGAIADGGLARRARSRGLDPATFLRENDSNSFFRKMGGLVVTGPTGTNVNDLLIVMVGRP